MGYHLLDMTAYARLDEYNYFRSLAYPYVGVTVNADITPLHARVRAEGLPFFPRCKQHRGIPPAPARGRHRRI